MNAPGLRFVATHERFLLPCESVVTLDKCGCSFLLAKTTVAGEPCALTIRCDVVEIHHMTPLSTLLPEVLLCHLQKYMYKNAEENLRLKHPYPGF